MEVGDCESKVLRVLKVLLKTVLFVCLSTSN